MLMTCLCKGRAGHHSMSRFPACALMPCPGSCAAAACSVQLVVSTRQSVTRQLCPDAVSCSRAGGAQEVHGLIRVTCTP